MYVVLLNYTRPLEEVDVHLADHRAYLARHYAAGDFLMSGRRNPRNGGLIIARAASKTALEAMIKEDPFYRAGVAEHEIYEFSATMTAPALEAFRES